MGTPVPEQQPEAVHVDLLTTFSTAVRQTPPGVTADEPTTEERDNQDEKVEVRNRCQSDDCIYCCARRLNYFFDDGNDGDA